MSKIELQDIVLDYEDNGKTFHALDGVGFSVEEGEFVSIIGSSGCGKSTTLSVLAGLIDPKSGTYRIDGKEVHGTGKNRGVVFQHYSLFPWMSVKKNVEFGIRQNYSSLSKGEISKRAEKYLTEVGLKDFMHKFPYQLSGGMQQRAAIARTLAMGTDILLMDEPFGAIDAKNRVILQDLLLKILYESEQKKTIIFVTHDVDEAILLSDRILFMNEKKIETEIRIPFNRPRNRETLSHNPEFQRIRREVVDLFYYEKEAPVEFEGGEGI